MKRPFLLIAMVCCISFFAQTNGVPMTRGEITELYFNNVGSWTIEITYDIVSSDYDSAICICSSTDTAALITLPTLPGVYMISGNNLATTLNINKSGDELSLIRYDEGGYLWPEPVSSVKFIWGNHPGSQVNAPQPGQSLIGLPGLISSNNYDQPATVKDTIHSMGYYRDPVRGTIQGYVYDSLMNPMPYQLLHINGIIDRQIWTDENGFFKDTTVYGMNYELYVNDGQGNCFYSVEPDSITNVELVLERSRNITVSGQILPSQVVIPGTYAIFTHESLQGPIDTFLTDSTGWFNADIVCGNYFVRYSREGHIPRFWPDAFQLYLDKEFGVKVMATGNVIEVERGEISGVWEGNIPHFIFGDISLPEGDNLELQAGCELVFCGDFSFLVKGTLLASGTENNNIYLAPHSSVNDWQFSFLESCASGGFLNYCTIQSVQDFVLNNASPQILNSIINDTKFIFKGNSAPYFSDNTFSANTYFRAENNSHPTIRKSFLTRPGVAIINLFDSSNVTFEYNTIHHCWCAAAQWGENQSFFHGNIISKSGGPTYFGSATELTYNLFINIEHCSGPIGTGITNMVNANGDSCDIFYNLFNYDPLFVNPENGDFNLLPESPAIDAGNPYHTYDPDSTLADIGAFYYDQLNTFVKSPVNGYKLYKIKAVPNPNSGHFSIYINSRVHHHYDARLNIFSINGRLQDTRNIAVLEKGENKIPFSQSLDPGIYVCTLEVSGKIMGSTKVIIISD